MPRTSYSSQRLVNLFPESSQSSDPQGPPPAKRLRGQPSRSQPDEPTYPPSEGTINFKLEDITIKNYRQAKKSWPIIRCQQQLRQQATRNTEISPVFLKEAQSLLEDFRHSLHLLAMISKSNVDELERRLGITGSGTASNSPWNRWLSFSIAANKLPMPARGDPNADEILAARDKANSEAYQSLTDDEHMVFTPHVFFALGGYPDYSAIDFNEMESTDDGNIPMPEVPKLSETEEARYRPIYEQLVDKKKVAKDREVNMPAVHATRYEKRGLQAFKKNAQQLFRDSQIEMYHFYVIACSKSVLGEGWCHVVTSSENIPKWVNSKCNFERIFPTYLQGKTTFDDFQETIKTSQKTQNKNSEPQPCDHDKKVLGNKLNNRLSKWLTAITCLFCFVVLNGSPMQPVELLGYLPTRGFPRVENPDAALIKRKIPVVVKRDNPLLSEEAWKKGFKKMTVKDRKDWLLDIESGAFRIDLIGGSQFEAVRNEGGPSDDGSNIEFEAELNGRGGVANDFLNSL